MKKQKRSAIGRLAFAAGYSWGTVVFNPRIVIARQAGRRIAQEARSGFHAGKDACAEQIRQEAERAQSRLAALRAAEEQNGEEPAAA